MPRKETNSLQLIHANIWTPSRILKNASLTIRNGKIQKIERKTSKKKRGVGVLDLKGHFLLPGLIDLHVNGIDSCDLTNEPETKLNRFSTEMAKRGVTTFLPTLISTRLEKLEKTISAILPLLKKTFPGAHPLGLHLEGPFISVKRRGAHSQSQIESFSLAKLKKLLKQAPNKIKLMTLAPERDVKAQAVRLLKIHGVTAAMGHSDATYSQAKEAIQNGFNYTTHLFNAMRPWHHRDPGLAGATLDSSKVYAEVIGDGAHVEYPILEMALQLKGMEKIILCSDEWVGFSNQRHQNWKKQGKGIYSLAGKKLVGSACSILEAIKLWSNATKRDWTELIPLATINPSKVLGLSQFLGSIEVGKRADLIVVTKDLKLKMTLVRGKIVPLLCQNN